MLSQLKFLSLLLAGTLVWSCKDNQATTSVIEPRKPNIIYILADDLGYGEIGAYGQEKIETPNIDALAENGMLFTQHYTSAPVCAPARYMFLTGTHSGHAYIRGNDEWDARGDVWNYKAMAKDSSLEGQKPMPSNTVTLGHRLQKVGYQTALIGKWGLGAPQTHSIPNEMGFDFFFGYNCQRQAHTYYPVHLYKNKARVHLDNDTVAPNTKLPKGADIHDPRSYAAYTLKDYSPDLMFKELTNFVTANKDHPFFLYWATPIPHVAIQASRKWLDHYLAKFGDEQPYLGENGYFPHKNPHAGYAAMISYLDENIGKLVQQLKEEGIYEQTLIIFTSDNGPTYAGGVDPEFFESARPFSGSYGKGKGFVYEGGIRVPMIASWPGHIKAGSRTNLVSAHYDMMATLGAIAGFEVPAETDGISFSPTLFSEQPQIEHDFMYWEFPEYGGQVAIRMGDWKVIRQNLNNDTANPTLEVYNLRYDPLETTNVAETHPEIIKKAVEIFKAQHTNSEVARFRIPSVENGLLGDTQQ